MKRLSTILISICLAGAVFSQQRAVVDKSMRDLAVKKPTPSLEAGQFTTQSVPMVKAVNLSPIEDDAGTTRYDDQSNASMQNRIYLFDDGTIGVTWIFGLDDAGGFTYRGAGYNYYDGNAWGDPPSKRIED